MTVFLVRTMLILTAFCGMAYLGYGLRMAIAPAKVKTAGAQLMVVCQKCGKVQAAHVRQIHACFCSECGNPVSEAWHCLECDKVFPFVTRMPKNREVGRKGLEDWALMHRCPFCKSLRTEPLPVESDGEQTQSASKLPRPESADAPPPKPAQQAPPTSPSALSPKASKPSPVPKPAPKR